MLILALDVVLSHVAKVHKASIESELVPVKVNGSFTL